MGCCFAKVAQRRKLLWLWVLAKGVSIEFFFLAKEDLLKRELKVTLLKVALDISVLQEHFPNVN